MKEDFDYSQVPGGYRHCLNVQCQRAMDCLRYQTALHASPDIPIFSTINPTFVAGKEECPYFQPYSLTRFALGITHLLDNLPHAKAVRIKRILYDNFGRTKFYRFRNKERLIEPEEQAFIRGVFKKEGIAEEPVFDEYVYKYAW